MLFNPKTPEDCGYQAMLRATRQGTSPNRVTWLRASAASMVYHARTNDIDYINENTHEPSVQEDLSFSRALSLSLSLSLCLLLFSLYRPM